MRLKSEAWLCTLGVFIAILLRTITSLHPYSGQGKRPMFGDYEAQRHWMEITLNLPVNEWYHNSTDNDLQYWGLDYPPLTAYHSYLCGLVASIVNPDFVALSKSRGYESEAHKLFMRYTVLLADILVYIPAIVTFFILTNNSIKNSKRHKHTYNNQQLSVTLAIILSLLYPGLILIDHGHFQYNCISLGFTVLAITFILRERNVWGSIFFCLALNYKQMELYHALPFFFYLLSTCIPKPGQNYTAGIVTLAKIGASVIVTFFIIWYPFLFDFDNLLQVIHRLFPFARGVFEDKVANVWCTLNVLYKFKTTFDDSQMIRLCSATTLYAVLPCCFDLFLRPNVQKFVPSLINSSLAFFLFSYQVHEKSILIAAVPVCLLIRSQPFAGFWFLIVSVCSMFPLFIKDELVVAFFALTIFYVTLFHVSLNFGSRVQLEFCNLITCIGTLLNAPSWKYEDLEELFKNNSTSVIEVLKWGGLNFSLGGFLILINSSLIFEPPERFPDLFALLISTYSCVHFLGFFIYYNIVQFMIPQAAEDVRYIKLKTL